MSPDPHRRRDGDGMRDAIVGVVAAAPGIHMSELRRQLDIGWGTVNYHLQLLMTSGELQVYGSGRTVRLFPAEMPEQHMRWLSAVHDNVSSAILQSLRDRPDTGLSTLLSELGYSRKILRKHLLRLDSHGMVQKKGEQRPRFQLTSDAASFLGECRHLLAHLREAPPAPTDDVA